MDDLQKMVTMLLDSGNWIKTLVEEQIYAFPYKDDKDEGLFCTNMELINEVPIRVDASQQSDEP